jgi:hypothetical protein
LKAVLDIFILIVYLAIFTVAVTHKGTGELIDNVGKVFTSSIKVAKE